MPDIKELKNKIEGIIEKKAILEKKEVEKSLEMEKNLEKSTTQEINKEIFKSGEGIKNSELMAGVGLTQQQQTTKKREKEIENILEENLEEMFIDLPAAKQNEFKQAGEKTAQEICLLLAKAKIKINKIINLIRRWLLLIPGVNKFFLEQEVKIKTDKILRLKR